MNASGLQGTGVISRGMRSLFMAGAGNAGAAEGMRSLFLAGAADAGTAEVRPMPARKALTARSDKARLQISALVMDWFYYVFAIDGSQTFALSGVQVFPNEHTFAPPLSHVFAPLLPEHVFALSPEEQ
jgi:hypothetical protein